MLWRSGCVAQVGFVCVVLAALSAVDAKAFGSNSNSDDGGGLGAAPNDRVYLPSLSVLVLAKNGATTRRRGQAGSQLVCMDGDACDAKDAPLRVDCYNEGIIPPRNQEEEIHPSLKWECIPSPNVRSIKFKNYKVECEGYAYPEDVYVLKDSCRLLFELWYTGEADLPSTDENSEEAPEESSSLGFKWKLIFFLLVLAAIAYVVRSIQQFFKGLFGSSSAENDASEEIPLVA